MNPLVERTYFVIAIAYNSVRHQVPRRKVILLKADRY